MTLTGRNQRAADTTGKSMSRTSDESDGETLRIKLLRGKSSKSELLRLKILRGKILTADSARTQNLMLKRLKTRLGLFIYGLFLFFLSGAETKEAFSQSTADNRISAVTISGGPDVPEVTLADVLRQVESNHPKLTGANINRLAAEAKLLEKRGAFDPVISASSDFLRYNSTSTPGKAAMAMQNQGIVEWTTRSGMKVFAGSRINYGRVKSPLSSTGETGEYFAGVALPLLRDRNVNAKSIGERQAGIGIGLANTDIAAVRLELFRNAAAGYWDWVAAKRKLDINRSIFEIAKERARQVAARVGNGDLAPIDSTEASMEVQRRMGNVVKAEQELQKSSVKLALYLWKDNGTPDDPPKPERSPQNFSAPSRLSDFIIREGVNRALSNRPELQNLQLMRDQNELEQRLAQNNRRPRVDLYLAPGQDTGFGSVGPTFKFGATVELPLRTRTADGQLAAARLKSEKILLDQQIERRNIEAEIITAAQNVNAAHDRHLLAKLELDLARSLEEGERRRFTVGDSTLFLVNQRERGTAEAEIKLIEIQAEYETALAAFKIATSQL